MKIAYFGGDMFFPCMKALVEEGHSIIALFTNIPDQDGYDFTQQVCKEAKELEIPIIYSKPTALDIKKLIKNNCDMIVSAGYAFKIPAWEGYCIKYAINIHPSLLPVGAGPMPLPLVIMKGLKITGVTLHKLTLDWDAGDIILQASFALLGTENLEELHCNSKKMAVLLLKSFMKTPDICWDNAFPQVRKKGDYWPTPKASTFNVRYTDDLVTISRCLRAYRFIDSDGNTEFISDVSTWKEDHGLESGKLLSEKDGLHLVATVDGYVSFRVNKKAVQK